jgi:ADP-ribosylglycohydrolase
MSACASWSLEGADAALLLKVAIEEAGAAAKTCGARPALKQQLEEIQLRNWTAPADGISLDPGETAAAVLACVARSESLHEGIEAAVSLGGDTDTVAALVAGLMGCQLEVDEIEAMLPWMSEVRLPVREIVDDLAGRLAAARIEPDDA